MKANGKAMRSCLTAAAVTLVALRGNVCAIAATPPNPIEAVSFSYEGNSRLYGSPVFADGKTDYFWGKIESVGNQARHYRKSVVPSNPDDSRFYQTDEYESYILHDSTILYCDHQLEIRAKAPLSSLKDAKSLFSSRSESSVHTMRYFQSAGSSAQFEVLKMPFLGLTPHGPLSALDTVSIEHVDGRDLYIYRSGDGTEYRFEYDPNIRLYTRYSIYSEADSGPTESYQIEGGIIDDAGSENVIVIRDTGTYKFSEGKPQIIESEWSLSDLQLDGIDPIAMQLAPQDGDRIDSIDTPQIRYEWRDGRIAKRFDGLSDSEIKFGRSRSRLLWLLGISIPILLLIVVAGYLRKRQST